MYFSYTFDVTNSFQRQAESNSTLPLWQRADDRFFWNRFVLSDLVDFRTSSSNKFGSRGEQVGIDPYILPVMFGMLEIRNTSIKGTPLTFVLTSRRSRRRVGTRYFTRGIDESGNVGNFNETEQAIILNDDASKGPVSYAGDGGMQTGKSVGGSEAQVLSYVQTRGSVPVYWAEINNLHYTPNLQVRGVETATLAAKRHFDEQIRTYGDNYLVNLVNQKGRERRVKEAYEQMVSSLMSSPSEGTEPGRQHNEKMTTIEPGRSKSEFDRLHYVYFDFHNETKGLQWHRAQRLMRELEPGLLKGMYFRGVDPPGDAKGRMEVRESPERGGPHELHGLPRPDQCRSKHAWPPHSNSHAAGSRPFKSKRERV